MAQAGEGTPGRRRWLTVLAAAALAAALAGCGNSNDGDDAANESLLSNHNEHSFAANPDLRADPDDVLTLQLEDPRGGADGELDTGEAAGVDVIPYDFPETAERTFCWNVAGPEPEAADGAPSDMRLIDEATENQVLRLEEGGDCVTQTIPAGRYRAVFRNRPSPSGERDVLFIAPQVADDSALLSDEPGRALTAAAPTPHCVFAPTMPSPPFVPTGLLQLAVIDSAFGLSLYYVAPGGCTDVTLIHDGRPRRDTYYPLYVLPGFKARIYADLYYRGPRKTVGHTNGNDASYTFTSPASMVLVSGAPDDNKAFLIWSRGCVACDLSGVNLDGVDLHGAWLDQSDFSHASLEGADLSGIVAHDTVFKSAHLRGANLSGADLQGATFDSAGLVEDASGQVYPAADLGQATLDAAVLTNALLRGATLTGASLAGATLDGVDLSGISANGANFERATMTAARLTNAALSDTHFDGARLDRANLQGATLLRARLPGANLQRASLHKDLEHQAASLDDAYLANAKLDNADLTGVSLRRARFYGEGASAENAIFDLAHLGGAVLSGANFTRASFRSATLDGAVCVNASFNTARLGRTTSQLTDAASLVGTDLRGADFTQATVDGCNFTGAIVSFSDNAGVYRHGTAPDVVYAATIAASRMGTVRTEASVRCPNGDLGPCNTTEKLTAPQPTPTVTPPPTATPVKGCTPDPLHGVFCPTRTPTPIL